MLTEGGVYNDSLKNKNSQVTIIEDAPHAVFRTHNLKFLEIIDGFINNVRKENSHTVKLHMKAELGNYRPSV